MTLDQVRARREQIVGLADRYGVSNVRVFGSVARGEERPDSDVDFLVDVSEQTRDREILALWQELEQLLGIKIDLIPADSLREELRDKVYMEAQSL